MSMEALAHAWNKSPHGGPTFLALIAIADIVNDQNGNDFWMSLDTLSKKTRMARSTAQTAVAKLEETGWLKRISAEKGKTVRYRFIIDNTRPDVWSSTRTIPRDGTVENETIPGDGTEPYRQTVHTIPPRGTNTNRYQTKTKIAETKVSADTFSEPQQLANAYFENLPDWAVKPRYAQIVGQMADYLKENSLDTLLPAVVDCSKAGKPISIWDIQRFQVKTQAPKPEDAPTPTPPRFDPSEYQKGDPMPANIRELVNLARKNAIAAD